MFGYFGTGDRVNSESANLTNKSGDLTGRLHKFLPRKMNLMGVLGFLALLLIGSSDHTAANAQITMSKGTVTDDELTLNFSNLPSGQSSLCIALQVNEGIDIIEYDVETSSMVTQIFHRDASQSDLF